MPETANFVTSNSHTTFQLYNACCGYEVCKNTYVNKINGFVYCIDSIYYIKQQASKAVPLHTMVVLEGRGV
jgi:hypothetical protein